MNCLFSFVNLLFFYVCVCVCVYFMLSYKYEHVMLQPSHRLVLPHSYFPGT